MSCPETHLEPGGSVDCSNNYLITQADLNTGSFTNVASGIGRYGESKEFVFSELASRIIPASAPKPPALTLELGADKETFSAVGDEIVLEYRLTNTGGVTLDPVLVSDSKVGAVVCSVGPLGPDGYHVCTASYSITQADLETGKLSNVAVGTGTYGGSEYVASDPASPDITYRAPTPPALTLEMDYDAGSFSRVDEVIAFTYTLTNTGGVTLDVSLSHTGVKDVSCPSKTLKPDEYVVCTGSYTITQDDLVNEYLEGSAVGIGTYGESEVVSSDAVSPNLTFSPLEPPALMLVMKPDKTTFSAVDEVIKYTYELTNTGGVALVHLYVTDDKVGDVDCGSEPLEPDEYVVCTGSYTITETDLATGSLTNFATGYGTYSLEGGEVASNVAELTIAALAP